MINKEKINQVFENYVKNYDLSNENIKRKYDHSYRVAENSLKIAESINLSQDKINFAYVCGLYHDIGRFSQWERFSTYVDAISVDHGDLGYEILKDGLINELNLDKKQEELLLFSTKFHNKLAYETEDEEIKLYTNIVRDADKIDILEYQNISITDDYYIIDDSYIECVLNGNVCKNKSNNHVVDKIIRSISWINDFNFNYSLNYLNNKQIINKKMEELKNNCNYDFSTLEKYVNIKMKEGRL